MRAYRMVAAFVAWGWMSFCAAQAAEITVLAAGATKDVFEEVIPNFEKGSPHKVIVRWAATADFKKRMEAGEVYDLVVAAAPDVESYSAQGLIVAGSRTDIMKVGIGVATRAGLAKPDISSTDAFKRTLLDAQSIAYSTGPSGVYLVDLFKRLGVAEQIQSKIKRAPSGVPIGSVLAKGDADIGFQQVSELISYPGITYVGPLPSDIQNMTVYSVGVHSGAKSPEAAQALIAVLSSQTVWPVIKEHGMEPPDVKL
jgi:molybdate transport system substrate-binding protein